MANIDLEQFAQALEQSAAKIQDSANAAALDDRGRSNCLDTAAIVLREISKALAAAQKASPSRNVRPL